MSIRVIQMPIDIIKFNVYSLTFFFTLHFVIKNLKMKFQTKIPIFSITTGTFFARWKKSTRRDRRNQYFCLKFHIWDFDGKMQREKKVRLILRTFGRLDHPRGGGTVQVNSYPKWHIFLLCRLSDFSGQVCYGFAIAGSCFVCCNCFFC